MILVKHVIHSVGNLKPEIRWLPVLLPSSHLKWNDLETGVHQAAYLLLQLHTSQEGKPYLMGKSTQSLIVPHWSTVALELLKQSTKTRAYSSAQQNMEIEWCMDFGHKLCEMLCAFNWREPLQCTALQAERLSSGRNTLENTPELDLQNAITISIWRWVGCPGTHLFQTSLCKGEVL